jgi:hypothetical protein
MLSDRETKRSSDGTSKERRNGTLFSSRQVSSSMDAAHPFFFEDFIPSYGGSSDDHVRKIDGGCTDGCFGIKIGGGGNKIPVAAEMDENEDDPTAVITQAMNNLSTQEREQAYEDIHGVFEMVQETPELIAKTLSQIEIHLQKIHHKPAYDLAIAIRADYVRDPKLRLMFLRADRFDPELASKRLIKFMDWKLILFGRDKLCQWHIGIADLDGYAKFMVESGVMQTLPSRDSRGRVVTVISSNDHMRLQRSTQSTLQMLFYTLMCATEDETNQIVGSVVIIYCLGKVEGAVDSEKQNSIFECTKVSLSVPLRLEVTHFCMNKTGHHFSMNLSAKAAGLFDRARFRAHFGSHMECEYALLSFGLPSTMLPFTAECELKTANQKKWIQRRIVKEQELLRVGVFLGVDLPNRNDYLLGQGKPFQHHPGNQRLQELCEICLDEYNQGNRKSKTRVAGRIVREFLHPSDPVGRIRHGGLGARFLKRRDCKCKGGWWVEETDEDVLIEKVCTALRSARKKR